MRDLEYNSHKALIIAEAGVNHNGSLDIAKELIDEAKAAGADIVKFQTATLDGVVSKFASMAEYQKNNIGKTCSQKEMLSKLLLPFDNFIILSDYCKKVGIQFLSTPFDLESIHFLDGLQNIWKIPSGEITNYPYLVEIAKTGKDIILSTGMSTLKEVDECLEVLRNNGATNIKLLHCTTNYPTQMKDVNLRAMLTLRNHCKCDVGYSDHTLGIEIPIAAVAMGARVIEKHFTLDRKMKGPDHKASLEPNELKSMIEAIRNVENAIGDFEKKPVYSEKANLVAARKSIVARKPIKKGELFTEENSTTKRPGNGVSPMKWKDVIGISADRNYDVDEMIVNDRI